MSIMKLKLLLVFGIVVGLTMAGSLCVEKYENKVVAEGNLTKGNVTTFKSKEEMARWVQISYSGQYYYYMPVLREPFEMPVVMPTPVPTPMPVSTPIGEPLKSLPERFSETNVQVRGIDEPDIVKTDGEKIYFSKERYPWWLGEGKTRIIKAFPPKELKIEYEINKSGELLLINNTLVLLKRDLIVGYNVSKKPEKIWNVELNGSLVAARLYNNTIYLVVKNQINYFNPCPIKPLSYNGKVLEIDCSSIYHPTYPIYVDSTYTIVALDAKSGEVLKAASFVGSSGKTVVYMSKNAIYIAYPESKDAAEIYYNFMNENKDLFPEKVIDRVEKLLEYNISSYSKFVEINIILEQYASSLSKDERLKFENEFWNRLNKYYEIHGRDLEKTGIVKVSLDLDVIATGKVPGKPLNQFSIDEYKGYLRIATTVSLSNTNDLYVLDSMLNIVGKLTDYGENERIYAVRFLMDKAYIVTFKETDPLFVVDLSNPENPEIKGELKISGYSSYLHPINKDLVLGIGKEDRNVKVSLFNVSDPENPIEVDRYLLKEYWSDILNTHHAFLIDKKHDIFFLPASNGGYVFSYKNSSLKLMKAVSVSALRAIYIDDYLYIIGDKVVVLDENTWQEVSEIELQ